MNKNFTIGAIALCITLIISACQTSPITTPTRTSPDRSDPINVNAQFIKPQAITPQAVAIDTGNLFENSGFESGLTGWTACAAGAIETSTDTLEGTGALKLNPLNCFYRSAVVEANQKVTLSCNVKLLSGTGWTGMGMSFEDETFTELLAAPTAITSSSSYARIDTQGTAPTNTSYVSMWLYSENPVVVDNCSLMLEVEPPQPPQPPSSDNLLENGTFGSANANNAPLDWSVGCGGNYTTFNVSPARKKLTLSNGACVDQGLSTNDVSTLAGKNYVFSCEASRSAALDYADLSVFFDGVATMKEIDVAFAAPGRVELFGTAPANARSAFVSIYSDGNLTVDNCVLKLRNSTPGDAVITFANSQLAEEVRRDLNVATVQDITETTILGLTELSFSGRPSRVDNLSGLEFATNLTKFSASNVSSLTDISPLAGLTSLTDVTIFGSQLTDVSPLAQLSNIETLSLRNAPLPTDALNVLANLTNIKTLNITRRSTATGDFDISVLANYTKLENLTALGSGISNISSLAALPNIKDLELAGNPIADLYPLVQNTTFAAGNELNISNNTALDLSDGSADRQAIDALVAKGVSVFSDLGQ